MKEKRATKYPIGIQNFADLREGGYLYVDKTSYIDLLKQGKYYFLSRPRRFGKSLLLSTIEAYFKGRRDLFEGLALDRLTDDWDPHPVLHIDLNNREYKDETSLIAELNATLELWENIYGNEKRDRAPEERFAYIIMRAWEITGKKVVILVDEYDKPLLNTIHIPELADKYRSLLKAFYSNLKSLDRYIEFGMLTGVARFSKVSIFSDLNNLNDITFDNKFAGICGITSIELNDYFEPGIAELAGSKHLSDKQVREDLKRRYDGYHFSEISPDIYNPFSLMNVFSKNDFDDYWFATGTPTYLWRLVEQGEIPFRDIAPVEIDRTDLKSAGLLSTDPAIAFYQTGYLTIKSVDEELNTFILDYPNEEVKRGFLKYLLHSFIPESAIKRHFSVTEFFRDVRDGRINAFMQRLESLLASIPYNEKGSSEDHFQNAIYLLFSLLGYFTRMEDRTSDGRIDLQVETKRYIYIFEFKIDSSAQKALEQILEKKYWLREVAGDRVIYLIGANFNTKTGCLDGYLTARPD